MDKDRKEKELLDKIKKYSLEYSTLNQELQLLEAKTKRALNKLEYVKSDYALLDVISS